MLTRSRILLSPPHVDGSERRFLEEALASNWLAPLGPQVDAFEREVAAVAGVAHAAALSSGTAAIHLGLLLLGVGPGDEVYVPTLTFAASAFPVRYCGATPVFIDVEEQSWNLCPDALEEELAQAAKHGTFPKAVVAVDLYGQCADYARIEPICARYGVPLLEDSAEAIGARRGRRPAGSFGRCGVFSFNGNKLITTSGGGALVSDEPQLVERARFLAAQAREVAPHYQHEHIGYNYRLSNLLAAVGRAQLASLEARMAVRRAHRDAYEAALTGVPGIRFMPRVEADAWNGWLTVVRIDPSAYGATREEVRVALEEVAIETRPVWKPLHLQPVFADCRKRGGSVAEAIFADGLCLPSGTGLTPEERSRVVEAVIGLHQKRRG